MYVLSFVGDGCFAPIFYDGFTERGLHDGKQRHSFDVLFSQILFDGEVDQFCHTLTTATAVYKLNINQALSLRHFRTSSVPQGKSLWGIHRISVVEVPTMP